MREKKAQVEISFNWIFILLAGGAILFFFIFVIFRETDASTERTDLKLAKRLDALLSAIEQNPNSIKDIGYFSTELNFDCVDGTQHEFFIKGSSSRFLLDSQLIFSPEMIGGTNIVAWTLDYNAPYPIASMLLLSDDKTRYIIDGALDADINIYDGIPPQFSKLLWSKSRFDEITDDGFRKYVFITTGSLPDLSASVRAKGQASVLLLPSSSTDGKIEFYESTTSLQTPVLKGTAGFVTKEMLFAAIVSGDYDLYMCGINKMIDRMRFSDDINQFRMKMLEDKYLSQTVICSIFYGNAVEAITSKQEALRTSGAMRGFHDRLSEFVTYKEDLERINGELLSASCPLMY